MNRIDLQTFGTALVAGTTAVDIRKFIFWKFDFTVTAAIATDAVFNILAAEPSADDNCVAGALLPVPEVAACDGVISADFDPAVGATLTIPAGTPIGSQCSGTIACLPKAQPDNPAAFVGIGAVSGDTANVAVVINQSRRV